MALLSSGCTWLNPRPAPQAERPPAAAPTEPPEVVSNAQPTSAPTDTVLGPVQSYLERLKNAKPRQPAPTTAPAPLPAAAYAADARPEPPPAPPTIAAPPPAPNAAPPAAETPQRPELGHVAVRPGETPRGARPASDTPGVNGTVFANNSPGDLREFLGRLPAGEDDSFREQLDRRLMWVVAGDFEKARTPLTLVTAEQEQLAKRLVEAYIAARDWHMGDQGGAATAALRELAELQRALEKLSELSIPVVQICSAVRGYGQYERIEPARVSNGAGTEFVVYCEIADFASEEKDGWYTTSFDITTSLLNRVGDTVLELKDANVVDRCRNRRHDCFIPRLVRLPGNIPPGQYTVKVTIVDKIGRKVAENRAALQLAAKS